MTHSHVSQRRQDPTGHFVVIGDLNAVIACVEEEDLVILLTLLHRRKANNNQRAKADCSTVK